MEQYIDKSAVVAEIERKIKEVSQIEKASYEIGLCDAYKTILSFLNTLEAKDMSMPALDNGNMPIERWKEACEAASCQANYRKSKGLTETCDDYFMDGVQWADEHPINAKNENKVEQKFHEGDWIIFNEHHNSVYQVEKIQGLQYYLRHYNGGSMSVYIDSQLIRQWTIEDAKDGDVLYSLDSKQPFIFKHRKKHEQAEVYCGINIYGKFFVENTKDCIITTDKYIPATKEQHDTLMKAMADKGWQFDFEKLELKKIEQSSAWSEDDGKMLDSIIEEVRYIGDFPDYPTEEENELYDECLAKVNWLKSLKNRIQPHWKPSDEQIKALEHFVRGIGESGYVSPYDANLKLVHSLLNDLKKLK